ncbi:HD domain-containing protein [Sulfolobus acidocaldarius]|uniref:Uncharacterized protein n=1 Tax=Sulfolobus acidocaldarius Ron12/I TaxID=1028567 RepID=M1J4T8_9CREN|nr:HD domain-containing protein [Sulfolobus acidocaldarius]AGE74256.1 hypothetical protein SacRon12I_10190 [Sulfolobus acidocaldarius Ron12/I]
MTLRGKLILPEFEVKFVEENKVKALREKIINIITQISNLSCEIAGNDERQAMNILADLLALIYKAPMILSYAPSLPSSKYSANAFEYLLYYVILRHKYGKELMITPDLGVKDLMDKLEKLPAETVRNLKSFFQSFKDLMDIYEALLYTPVDTRPGFNFTSLASHLQLTSLVVWAMQQQTYDQSQLRVAALLHDIGKLVNPEHHVRESVDILEEVLRKSTGELCIKGGIEKIRDEVLHHHGQIQTILNMADDVAASHDRISPIVMEGLDNLNLSVKECYSKRGEDSFNCLESKGAQEYEKASKELYKYLSSVLLDPSVIQKDEAKVLKYLNDVKPAQTPKSTQQASANTTSRNPIAYLVYVDFPGIQKFITNFPGLREMSFASFLVDFITSVYAFALIDSKFRDLGKSMLPVEALLSGYGGHSYIVVRADLDKPDIEGLFKNLKLEEELDAKLNVTVLDFMYDNEILGINKISEEIGKQSYNRYLLDFNERLYSYGLHETCSYCGIRPAVDDVPISPDEKERLCKRCKLVRELSSNRGFSAKTDTTYMIDGSFIRPADLAKSIFKGKDSSEGEYLNYAMEFIAGWKNENDKKYISLVKADGNYAGIIFSATVTFSDYVDRSFRLDYGIKKAFYETLKELHEKETSSANAQSSTGNSLVPRVLSGVLYLGGDDIMLMSPSVIAIQFAVRLFKKAQEYTGFTFKVGVLTVKPDHPVQFAYQAVNELMERAKIGHLNGSPVAMSSIAAMLFSNSLANRNVIDTEINKYSGSKHNEIKYKFLVVSNPLENVEEFLKSFGLEDFKELVNLYNNEREGRNKVKEVLRPIQDVVGYLSTINKENKGSEDIFFKGLAYMVRQRARVKENQSNTDSQRKVLSTLLQNTKISNDGGSAPLYDYYFILKSILAGLGEA